MEYPKEDTIKNRLRPYAIVLWIASGLLLGLGMFLDWTGLVPEALSRAGALSVLLALAVFFYLEKREFLTGNPAHLFDSAGHVVPKGIIGPHVTWTTILGSFTAIFGDLIVSLLKCGAMKC
ncbi:hypothetical protein ACSSV4_000680 [Roseovarius sp. MBR-154]|jgi:hypothetical protein